MTTTPSASAATAIKDAVVDVDVDVNINVNVNVNVNGGKKLKQKPPIVSPTPTPEQLGDLATAMVQKNEISKNYGSSNNASKNHKKTSSVRSIRGSKKEVFATVGHHDEMCEENANGASSSSSSGCGCGKTKKPATTTTTTTASSTSPCLSPSSPSNHPPLISRYCGCCGDILSTKAYGFDEENRDRRLRFHPQDNGIGTDRERIREAAESVRQRLLKGKNKSAKSSKSTKASRKKKKAAAANRNSIHDNHYHDFFGGLSPWPEESLKMDMTILEGLISLKNTHSDEVGCRCWHGQTTSHQSKGSVSNSFGGTKSSLPQPTTKAKKAKASKGSAFGSSKAKTATKKKTTLTKGAGSCVSKISPEVVSTKTVIVRCPKTGKKIKKTVRVVKKLIKKKRSSLLSNTYLTGAALVSAATLKGASSSTAQAGVASTSIPRSASQKKAAIPSFSVLGSGNKENRGKSDNVASKGGGSSGNISSSSSSNNSSSSKKRSRDSSNEDEDCESGSDDGSDDGTGSSSLKKRRRNDEKADPDLRDRLMNCQLENGPLFPSQQELMELTTIRKRNALQTFYKRFNELRQFIGVFGDANVPQQFPENHSLGIWVNKMRMERKKWDTGSERTSLTERKIELLESIDFIWAQNHKGEIGWERRFQEIRKFKRKHGHCNVPTKSAENRALGRWVSTQRTMYKNYMKGFVGKSLTREEQERRIFLLLKEGFLFSMIPNGQNSGVEEPNGEGSDSIEAAAVPSSGLVSKAEGASDGTVTATTETTMTPVTEASNTTIDSKEPESPKTSTYGKEVTIEQKKNDEVSNNDDSEDKKGDCDNEKDAKAAVPLSPSSQTKGTIENPEAEASTASASRPPSIAQVSVTTTPTTTPSVSTTASPDLSPEKAISSSEEPDCARAHAAKAEAITEEAESTENQMKGDDIPTTTNAMPVAPSLKTESATIPEDSQNILPMYFGTKPIIKNVISIKEAITGTESHTSTEIAASSVGNTTPDAPITEAHPRKENTCNPLEYKGNINRAPPIPEPKPVMKVATSATSPVTDPMEDLLSKGKTVFVTAPEPSITTEATTKEKNPSAAAEPRLLTSDGLRIIVTMKDFEDDEADRSPRVRQGSTAIEDLPLMAPSPSRRSVRARKPSARQMEAEKSPLRESILGR